ncbi:MAG: TRAM domain-containing protein, partial [Prochlorococcaceae cyanobacterium ETNP1_MAG_9]|nr:TRAM domain-containing protein [Prochlorococcaceae cyanobacterium ETNP1_MAG_9]
RYQDDLVEVLVEGINPKDPQQLMGRSRTNRLTFFPKEGPQGCIYKAGELVELKIKEVRSFSLSGIPLE